MPIASDYIYLPMTSDTEGNTSLVRDFGNAGVFANDVIDILGSGHTYSNGFFYPSGNQTGSQFNGAALSNLLRLGSRVGGILVMYTLDLETPNTAEECLIYAGHLTTPEGGWKIVQNGIEGGTVYQPINAGGSSQDLLSKDAVAAPESRQAWYWDVSHPDGYGKVYSFIDGLCYGGSSDMNAEFPIPRETRAFSLFNRRTNDGGSTADPWNANGNVGVSQLYIISFEYDAFQIAYKAAKQYHLNNAVLPAALEGA